MKPLILFFVSSLICLGSGDINTLEDYIASLKTTTTTTTEAPRTPRPCPYPDSSSDMNCNGCDGDPCRFDRECCFGLCNYVTRSCFGPVRTHGTPYPPNPNTPPRIF